MKMIKPLALIAAVVVAITYFSNQNQAQPIQQGQVSSVSTMVQQTPETIKPALILLGDDSGALTNPEQAKQVKLLQLAQVKALSKKRKYANADLIFISTAYARKTMVAKISDLKTPKANEIVQYTESNPNACNKLAESFSAVETSIMQLEQQGYNELHIFVFSSMISTPSPCADVKITLPQLPIQVNWVEKLAHRSVANIQFLWVNPHQLKLYQEALNPLRLWANANGKAFGIYDEASTENALRQGLPGVK